MARTKNQSQRRDALISATLKTVGETGLRSVSLADVARRAGLTRGAILYYYDDLDALLLETHRAGVERFCDAREAVIAALDDPRRQLSAAISEGLPTGPDDALMRLLYEFDVLAGTSSAHDEMVEHMFTRQLDIYRRVLTAGTDSGDFSPAIGIEQLALNLVALEDAYGLHIVAGNSLLTVADAEAAMRSAASGLGAAPA
ncbi:TetR/AcrR family transcriptional regulator [Brevibacterium casei]|uniref:TetR family transcriptional regulator n=2 Tax=Brevibacterium casei TaxID=33889 RepID=A0A269ZEJ1_9MICO|nr:TetR family transcriptional regulator [Brevibacterium casei]PAK96155.1 TetR family transcriptional regulator [Brevibacterium casei]QPR39912.1 TetR family transcriptional regulator [Brevibacterium casei]QPR44076.1 TetR family transcriptional regulator [Brevibacterium casei]SMX90261.1 transcriptional regulator, TetR family [Brevibacterium casei CIP 102111]VEW10394.1 transcriptional regulator BetI [Brevibacterium casei]